VRNSLIAQGTWQDSDAPLLDRYVRALLEAEQLRAQGAAEDAIVKGSRGQPRINPLLALANEAEERAHKYAEALLLTPKSRRQHGVEVEPPDEAGWG
jgi:phage terminase small subunit